MNAELCEFFNRHQIGFSSDDQSYIKYKGWYFFTKKYDVVFVKEDLSDGEPHGESDFLLDGKDVAKVFHVR